MDNCEIARKVPGSLNLRLRPIATRFEMIRAWSTFLCNLAASETMPQAGFIRQWIPQPSPRSSAKFPDTMLFLLFIESLRTIWSFKNRNFSGFESERYRLFESKRSLGMPPRKRAKPRPKELSDGTIPYEDEPGVRIEYPAVHAAMEYYETKIREGHTSRTVHPAMCAALAAKDKDKEKRKTPSLDFYTHAPGARYRIPDFWEKRSWDSRDSVRAQTRAPAFAQPFSRIEIGGP
jgi:hypothetical protein